MTYDNSSAAPYGGPAPYSQQPGLAAAPAPRTSSGALTGGAGLQIVGGIAAVVGVFLAWMTISGNGLTVSLNGLGKTSGAPAGQQIPTDGVVSDGWIVIAGGVLALLGGIVALAGKKAAVSALGIIGGIGILVIAIKDLLDINDGVDKMKAQASAAGVDISAGAGVGLWIVIVGGGLALIGGIVGLAGSRKRV